MLIDDLPTPCLILDRTKVAANCQALRARIEGLGTMLRPHMKTAKSAEVAELAAPGKGAITVSTLLEAEYFLDHGYTDITYAVGITADKLDRAAGLMDRGCDLKIMTDQVATARAIAAHGASFKVLIEIDCGDHRGGLAPGDAGIVEVARALGAVDGILTHAGHSYDGRDRETMERIAEEERAAAVRSAEQLRDAGFDCSIVSVGSTPTAVFARNLDGVTEVRAGVYMFSDLFQVGIGAQSNEDLAMSVLSTVIAVYPERGKALIDAGGLALSKDRSCADLAEDCGYGLMDVDGLVVTAVSQEHGHVTETVTGALSALTVGQKVQVYPNHACMTAAAYDCYHLVDGGSEIVGTWERCNGW